MQIYSIVIYNKLSQKIQCEVPAHILKVNAHSKIIKQTLLPLALPLINITGIHKVTLENDFYYVFVSPRTMAMVAVNQSLSPHHTLVLYQALEHAHEDHILLESILKNPEHALKTKIDEVKGSLDELKDTTMQTVDKIIQRGERIEILLKKTEALTQESIQFNKKAHQLKNRYLCPGVFFFFSQISQLWQKTKVEHEFQPIEKSNRFWQGA